MLQVIQVVNRVYTSNTYIVFDEDYEDCWLIDIGDYELAMHALPVNKRVAGIMLTHTHFDHIYGLNDWCMRFPDCVVYTSKFGREALMDDRKNLSLYHNHSIVFEGKHLIVVGEGDEIPLMGERKMLVSATPGHDPGCLTFRTSHYIFTGDSFIPTVKVVTKLPGGDRVEAAQSVDRIRGLAKGRTICPGHGKMVAMDQDLLFNWGDIVKGKNG